MNQNDYIDLGLNGEEPLKVILRGSVETVTNDKVGPCHWFSQRWIKLRQ